MFHMLINSKLNFLSPLSAVPCVTPDGLLCVCSGPAVALSRKCQVDRKFVDVPQFDLQGVAREECEGMETTETESVSTPGTPLTSLEHLLTAPDPKHGTTLLSRHSRACALL